MSTAPPGAVVASPLLAVTPRLLAFVLQVTQRAPGAVWAAPETPCLYGISVIDAQGIVYGALCVRFAPQQPVNISAVRDAAHLLAATLQRHQTQAHLQGMLDGLHEGVVLLDHRMQLQCFNRRAADLLGTPGQGLSQHDFHNFGQQAHDLAGQPIPLNRLPMWTALQTGQPQLNITLGARLPTGEQRWLRVNARPVWPRGVVASLTDITEGVRLRQAMQQALEHDALTGLPNRVIFETQL